MTKAKAVRAPKVLLGGTEPRWPKGRMVGGAKGPDSDCGTPSLAGGRHSVTGARARRGKGPHATVFDGGGGPLAGWYGHAEPGLGSKANRREVATCADPRVVALVPCRTPWERAHLIRMYDRQSRDERLAPNAVGRGRNVVPLPGSVPRLYPACEMTRPDAHGRGGHRSFDDVYDETEMRRRAMDRALGVRGHEQYGADLGASGAGHRAADALVAIGPERARQVCKGR